MAPSTQLWLDINDSLNDDREFIDAMGHSSKTVGPLGLETSSRRKKMERRLEELVFASRWLLLPFLVGLCLAVLAYLVGFGLDVLHLFLDIFTISKMDALMSLLRLIDSVLVVNLLIMVVIAGYESVISKLDVDAEKHGISWLGKLDAGSLKVKVATSIVAISSIHLLQVFMDIEQYSAEKIMWLVFIHLTFVISSVLLAMMDRFAIKH